MEFRHACICVNKVVSSSNVSLVSPTTTFRCFLKLLTTASHRPQKCGACSGMNIHCVFWLSQQLDIDESRTILLISLAAPMKFVPLSPHMVAGMPLRATNLHNVVIKASVVNSVTASKCTALTDRHTKTATLTLGNVGSSRGTTLCQDRPSIIYTHIMEDVSRAQAIEQQLSVNLGCRMGVYASALYTTSDYCPYCPLTSQDTEVVGKQS